MDRSAEGTRGDGNGTLEIPQASQTMERSRRFPSSLSHLSPTRRRQLGASRAPSRQPAGARDSSGSARAGGSERGLCSDARAQDAPASRLPLRLHSLCGNLARGEGSKAHSGTVCSKEGGS